jgi:methylphosphotriester-DNA--protein-cysteine methyltransferase
MDSNNHESLESEMEEGHNPLTAVADSIASVKAASEIGKKQPLRKGDKQNSQSMEKAAGATMAKEDVEGTFEEDLAALVESEATLSEGFRAKAEVIFEAALSSKLSEHVERLEEQYETQLSEEVTRIQEELVEKVDGYLGYVVESWMDENKLAIENGLRTEIAESFMSALHGVFTEHYIQVPDEKVDLVDGLADKIGELEEQLNRTVQDNIDLVESVKTYARQSVISELAKDLSEAQAEKLKALVEDISFESEDTFAQKVETIKESYFKKASVQTQAEEELLDENTKEVQVSPMMQQYLNALKK